MKTSIQLLNPSLDELEPGLWVSGVDEEVPYTDGEYYEQYLTQLLNNSIDVSIYSEELDKAYVDWPVRYHLSAGRSHIIAGLNLGEQQRILEVGCGCGAITRYLADEGHFVDAIEGSRTRASIARLRCRDKANVNIIADNFHKLNLSPSTYDIVLFIGVLEYAQRFGPKHQSSEQTIVNIVEKALESLVPDGSIIIAIENRIGFKYAFGAGEDHIGNPYFGISGYPFIKGTRANNKSGIATFSMMEWQNILAKIDNAEHQFYFPFPDYKFPDVLLSNQYVNNNLHASNLLRKAKSFDPTGHWVPPIDEYVYWRHAALVNTLGKAANSFGIVVSKQELSIINILDFDFVCYPNRKRKDMFQTHVKKKTNSVTVTRPRIKEEKPGDSQYKFLPQSDQYCPGRLLIDHWSDVLLANPELAALEHLVREMYQQKLALIDAPSDQHNLDLIILNILIDAEDRWCVFDREWFTKEPVPIDLLMFRSLLYFACIYPERLSFTNDFGWYTVFDFVDGCFAFLNMDFASRFDDLVKSEDDFQKHALYQKHFIPAKTRLSTFLGQNVLSESKQTPQMAQLYLADEKGQFHEESSQRVPFSICADKHWISFVQLISDIQSRESLQLRFDPVDHSSEYHNIVLQIFDLKVSIRQNGQQNPVWSSDKQAKIISKLIHQNMQLLNEGAMPSYLINHPDPQLLFKHRIPDNIRGSCSIHFGVCIGLKAEAKRSRIFSR